MTQATERFELERIAELHSVGAELFVPLTIRRLAGDADGVDGYVTVVDFARLRAILSFHHYEEKAK